MSTRVFAVLTLLLFVAIGAATPLAQRAGGAPAAPPLVRENATEKITEHVYVIPDNSVSMVPNVGIIVGSRATLVVDTGLGARNGQTVVREMQKVSKTPELYLATTHFHPEHDLGAGGFPAHTKMIRSQDQQKEIAEQGVATAERFRASLIEGGYALEVDIPVGLPQVCVDGRAVSQALEIIIDNALKYGADRRTIAITARNEGAMVRLTVADRGIGIHPDDLARVQERFFRGRNAPANGSGLGLAIASRIIRQNGGDMTIESELGVGTTVHLLLRTQRP